MRIPYIERQTGELAFEEVFGGKALQFLYGTGFGRLLAAFLAKLPVFSRLFGAWQKCSWTKRKILPFIERFHLDQDEFLEKTSSFLSFNDFFIRKLKLEKRPIKQGDPIAVIPADGRYLFYPNIKETSGFWVKEKKFSLEALLKDQALASQYEEGSLVLARLCPYDYHRFHFPLSGTPGKSRLINGDLFSVNPIALKQNIHIYTENKRVITEIENVLLVEIGAMCVGSIVQTYQPGRPVIKGEEKGYFEFGGSSLILLFPKGVISFDEDLLQATKKGLEVRCLMGQSMGILYQ